MPDYTYFYSIQGEITIRDGNGEDRACGSVKELLEKMAPNIPSHLAHKVVLHEQTHLSFHVKRGEAWCIHPGDTVHVSQFISYILSHDQVEVTSLELPGNTTLECLWANGPEITVFQIWRQGKKIGEEVFKHNTNDIAKARKMVATISPEFRECDLVGVARFNGEE